jgi:hypothetical protein
MTPSNLKETTFQSGSHLPNPATEYVHIRLEQVNMDNVKISMHNIIGNEINIETERIDEHETRIRVKILTAATILSRSRTTIQIQRHLQVFKALIELLA